MTTDARIEKVCGFYRDMSADSVATISEVYAKDAVFCDPAGEVRGRDALHAHFVELLKDVRVCRFDFERTLACKDEAALFWRMTIAARRLNGGREYAVAGASRLAFDSEDKVRLHRDYFDMGALIYERLPLVGATTRALKRRLAARQIRECV